VNVLAIVLIVAAAVAIRLVIRRQRAASKSRRADEPGDATDASTPKPARPAAGSRFDDALGDVGKVANREIRERVHGRIFQVGTAIILLIVIAAIVIPKLTASSSTTVQDVGFLGPVSSAEVRIVHEAALGSGVTAKIHYFSSLTAVTSELRSEKIDVAIVSSGRIWVKEPASLATAPADEVFVSVLAARLGLYDAIEAAGLSPAQAATVAHAKPAPVHSLQPGKRSATQSTALIGLVLLFIMLSQYCTWVLMGVMQEKASRVVEVLLSTVRAIVLLAGKVIGIGLVALGQATLIVAVALASGAAVGSNLLHGTAPLILLCELLWLLLGYAFYCWLYAAAGSTAERQDQVQTLALPLSIPILVGYVYSISVAASGHASVGFKVLAYVPFTAPFCMPVLVSLNEVTWWQFVLSGLVMVASIVAMALFAAGIYRRAILRTGGRPKLRELLAIGH
jgi:ABC-2 type transport system permease protein